MKVGPGPPQIHEYSRLVVFVIKYSDAAKPEIEFRVGCSCFINLCLVLTLVLVGSRK